MGVRIEAREGGRLTMSGDVETAIQLSSRALRDGFAIAVSDGTLVRGCYDEAADACRFSVAAEGAALSSIKREQCGDVVDLSWRIDWISIAPDSDALCVSASEADDRQPELRLPIPSKQAA
jgi:hypothetical protein